MIGIFDRTKYLNQPLFNLSHCSLKLKLLTIVLFLGIACLNAQDDYLIQDITAQLNEYRNEVLNERKTVLGYSVGFMLDLGTRRNGSLKAFANIGFLQKINKDDFSVLFGGQSHIEFYRGGLGTSLLNEEKFKINIELRNSFTLLAGFEDGLEVAGKPAFVNVGTDASSLIDPLDYSFSLGTIFINGINHSRHQRIGNLALSIANWNVHYYNDGPPFHALGLSDRYDRYWTGGGQMGVYFKNDKAFITDVVLRFDNYTGYQLNLYEVGSLLQIDNLPYKLKEQQMFNQARFQYKIGIRNNIYVNWSIFEPFYSDIQNLIHYHISVSPFHARPYENRRTLGLEYIYRLDYQ